MCFSAPVSFISGVALLAAGSLTTSRARHVAEVPFALIPALFGVQQLLEGALWLTFQGACPQANYWLTQSYSAFSQVIWPIYIPLAVWVMEPIHWRRRLVATIALAGGAVSAFLLYYLVSRPAVSVVEGHHIAYLFPHFHQFAATGAYLLGACVSPLLSSYRTVRLFGMLASLSMVVTYLAYAHWFISVWCFFAAVLSTVILVHFPRREVVNGGG